MNTKSPMASKINIAAIILLLVNVLATWDILSPDLEVKIITTMNLLTPFIIIVFRTYFTNSKVEWKPRD